MACPSEEYRYVEVREEEMISPMNGVSSLRTSYFLRPYVTSFDGPVFYPPFDSVNPTMIENSEPLKAKFVGWRRPLKDWKRWVNRMRSLHHSTWGLQRSGVPKDQHVCVSMGRSYNHLEDMMFLGRFSVLGDSVLSSPGDGDEMIIQKLLKARADITRGTARRDKQSAWIYKFMDHESEIEHEAFLAYWLSRIYKNLSSLKDAIVVSRKLGTRKGPKDILKVKVAAPLQLVQAWVWERFPTLRPKPNSMGFGEPRLAQWHGLKKKGT
ncbi:Aminotransferase-like [Abeliophyllum distichum]|uniref:Aminotransferase-like n=1 Tax=Abeliophyllum distichum TaxID=126358 RepID=A0ABD1RCE7_9LAMI